MQFIENEYEGHRMAALRHLDIIIATGRDDRLIGQARAMSSLLWRKGIGNALREWDGWSHDWQYWHHMMKLYVGGHD
jgi:esterase/lipase superfamily enzyme